MADTTETFDRPGSAIADPLAFVFGGDARFALINEETGKRIVYKVKRPLATRHKDMPHWVQVETPSGLEFIGGINGFGFERKSQSKLPSDDFRVKAIAWYIKHLRYGDLPDCVRIEQLGQCCKCGLSRPGITESGICSVCGEGDVETDSSKEGVETP